MKKINRFIFGGFVSGLTFTLLATLNVYSHLNKKMREMRNNDWWKGNTL